MVVAVHLHVSQRTDLVGTAGHIESVIDGGKCRHGIGARGLDLTHHADGDGTRLANGEFDAGTLESRTQHTSQLGFGLTDGEPAQLDDSYVFDGYIAIGRNRFGNTLL